MVRALTTILAPTAGRAWVAGLNVTEHPEQVRAKIGVALEEVGLDDLITARELLVLQSRLFGSPAAEAAATVIGYQDRRSRRREGEEAHRAVLWRDEEASSLALALVHDPLVLFLDEPTTGLDPASRLGIWEEVNRLNKEQGMTIFLTTQYLEEADKLADEVAIISKGKILAQGSPRQLKKDIGDQVVTLSFDSDERATRADVALAELCLEKRLSGQELFCFFVDAADMLPALIRRLDESAIPLGGLILSEPTLDDVFSAGHRSAHGGVAAGEESDADGLRADGGTPDGRPSPGHRPIAIHRAVRRWTPCRSTTRTEPEVAK